MVSDCLGNVHIVNVVVDSTLHHRTAVIVLDVAFPPVFGHGGLLLEPLLPEVLNRIVVCIGQKVLQTLLLSMSFQSVHEASSVPLHLLRGSDSQKHNLCKLLFIEGSKDAPSQDLWSLLSLAPNDYHGLMLSVHDESNNVIPRHPWQLLSNNVLKVH